MRNHWSAFRARLGPGLIFAAAAVGTSHVVQSTRAGAGFGLTMVALILLICALKYPLFRFAADYAASTGESLVRGYGRRGRTLVLVMFFTSAIEAVAATAGVSLVSASILSWMLGIGLGDVTGAIGLLILTAAMVMLGRYRLLESLTGLLVAAFSLLTLAVTLFSLASFGASAAPVFDTMPLTTENFSFAIAVSGWMPIGNTAAIMLAAWILARKQMVPTTLDSSRFDFNLGYLASAFLAVCFVVIGAAVLHGRGDALPGASAAFVTTFVGLYTAAIGNWSSLLVATTALAVMYSTLLAIVDGFPRLIGEFLAELRRGATDIDGGGEIAADRLYLPAMAIVVTSASALLYFFLDGFATFIDLVTTTGFLTAPVVALANQLVITGDNVPPGQRPGPSLLLWNRLAVGVLTLSTLGFLYFRFV
jgi:Mn2+/Fe2+ NRAMP family transporter